MSYRESAAFRASRARTAKRRYWKNPERERARVRRYRLECKRDALSHAISQVNDGRTR